ncbi:hypothetical protein GIB67_005380 [Kingdonia uniflora]|uniref:Uncharacterized protein n=1 Tax=Kingdonia uniflora TaxID=39325 RepID=A0A7J7NHY9_9MAGN|nr:hypothetical protein GIB67_005380 [Kingdonia uniflora]
MDNRFPDALCDRLLEFDENLLVRSYAMERLAEIFRLHCLKCSDASISSSESNWVPGKILKCFYDKDKR